MPPGETTPAEYREHLGGNLAWCDGEIEVAVAEREDAIRRRRVVAPDVLPPSLAWVGKLAVELYRRQESRIEDVAILVVVAAPISALPLAGRKSMRTFDVFVVSPFQNRMQARRVERQQFAELWPPAHPGSVLDRAS
jgi:hypothetical protein